MLIQKEQNYRHYPPTAVIIFESKM